MNPCTWDGCVANAAVPQVDIHGRQWANLCPEHDLKLNDSIGGSAKEMLSNWIKAKGGAKRAAADMPKIAAKDLMALVSGWRKTGAKK